MESIPYINAREKPRSFLDLPAEIRMHIYQMLLENTRPYYKSYYNLTLTCQTVRCEALPVILKASSFSKKSLRRFIQWVTKGRPEHLELVRDIHITLTEECYLGIARSSHLSEDPSNFEAGTESWWDARYGQLPEQPQETQESLPNVEDLDLDLESSIISSIWKSLCSVRNINSIWICSVDIQHFPYKDSSQKFPSERQIIFEMLSSACPNLLSLYVNSELHSLNYLQNFSKLKDLAFTGFSMTSPEKTLSILRSLESLDSIRIRSRRLLRVSVDPRIVHSLTPDVLGRIHPLKSYRAFEFSMPIIKALRAHSQLLQHLEISTQVEFFPNKELILEVLDFISTCPIRDIHVSFNVPEDSLSVDFNSFFKTSGSKVDVFLYTHKTGRPNRARTPRLAICAGKYFPSVEMMVNRQRTMVGSSVPTTET
jgi:hypothetical protein